MKSKKEVPVPEGFDSWLDYAVANCDVRHPWLVLTMTDDSFDLSYSDMSEAVHAALHAEVKELRARAEKAGSTKAAQK